MKNSVSPVVAIVLVNWKRAYDTCLCLDSLAKLEHTSWFAVVCDNGSPDGSGMVIRDHLNADYIESTRGANDEASVFDYFVDTNAKSKNLPKITLLIGSNNLGFSKGNNLGLENIPSTIAADYFWFLNNDTEVLPDSLSKILSRIQQDVTIGICGCTLVYAHDRKTVQALGGAEYSNLVGSVREIGNQTQVGLPVDQQSVEKRMSYVSGASMLVSKEFLETVGPLSEDYFLYYEEIDWAIRARKKGFRLGYASDAIVYHKEGAALGSGKSEGRSLLAEYYGVRNRLVFTRKFYPWALPSVFCFSLLQVLRRCLQGRWGHARLMAAVLFGLRKVPPR